MSSRDVIIHAENLSKVYRLYTKLHYRFLDMFGLLRKPNAYTEHMALQGVSLEIRRGEKIAFIGRNGAGKSTLLKLFTGVIKASSGVLTVSQGAHALLQIGSGFHQDFTGRQNALAYLAHLGLSGGEAERRVAEIVDFAELEEYIDQPIKTYSTGMVARLMFATSTAIDPELLVLDEILGVGDAYFAHKSFERIREMCEVSGTTVLLVSHDIYAAANLCERMVWIDRGRIVFDGPTQDAMKAYEMSIREQEERRLRAKKLMTIANRQSVKPIVLAAAEEAAVIIEFMSPEAMHEPVYFRKVTLCSPGNWEVGLPVTEPDAFSDLRPCHLVRSESTWSEMLANIDGQTCREMMAFGSPFHKVAGMVRVPVQSETDQRQLQVKCSYRSAPGLHLKVTCFDATGADIFTGVLPSSEGEWTSECIVSATGGNTRDVSGATRAIGTNRIQILDARFIDLNGQETFLIQHGKPTRVLVDFRVNDADLRENAQVVIALHRDGAFDTCRFITRDLSFDGRDRPLGTIEFSLKKMPLSNGHYTLTVLIAEEGYYDQEQTQYFTINPGVYACHSKLLEIEVVGGGGFSAGTVFVGEAQWDFLERSLGTN